MYSESVSVWFACRSCRQSFQKLQAFMEHKIENHFQEFQNTKCIIFEERAVNGDWGQIGSCSSSAHEPSKEAHRQHHNSLKIKVESSNDPSICIPKVELTQDVVKNLEPIKVEPQSSDRDLTLYESRDFVSAEFAICVKFQNPKPKLEIKSRNSSEAQPNPYVLLRRLNPNEILFKVSSIVTKHEDNEIASYFPSVSLQPEINFNQKPVQNNKNNSVQTPWSIDPQEISKNTSISNSFAPFFQCKLCLKKCESKLGLTTHKKACALSHQHRSRFCVPCNKKFSTKYNLTIHTFRRHATDKEKAKSKDLKQCKHCPKIFMTDASLIGHSAIHKLNENRSKTKLIGCETHIQTVQSNNVTVQQSSTPKPMKNHIFRNPKIQAKTSPPYKCPQLNCGKTFKTEFSLKKHLLDHLDEKPFKCPHPNCSKTFKKKVYIYQHMSVHSDSRPFKCPEVHCGKSFKVKLGLVRHRETHLRARPFKCSHPNCDVTCKTIRTLRRHLKIHSHDPKTDLVLKQVL